MRPRHPCTAKLGTAEESSLSQVQHASTPMHSTSLHLCTHILILELERLIYIPQQEEGLVTRGILPLPHLYQCVCIGHKFIDLSNLTLLCVAGT